MKYILGVVVHLPLDFIKADLLETVLKMLLTAAAGLFYSYLKSIEMCKLW